MAKTGTRWLWATLAFATLACDDLSEFRTSGRSLFRGEVVGSDSEPGEPSFIRQGFESHTRMELTFDPALAGVPAAADGGAPLPAQGPGTITTFVCQTDARVCPKADREPGHFQKATLLPIESLAHDVLSQYSFPGGSRLRNYIFDVRFDEQVDGETYFRNAMVFLSLMESGRIEVRVLSPALLDADGAAEISSPLFGVFKLERGS